MVEHLSKINQLVDEYNDIAIPTAMSLSNILKQMTSQLFYLGKYRADYKLKYNGIIFNSTKGKSMSVAAATIKAEQEVPELYMLRYVMKGAYGVIDALRTNISTLNKER